MRIRVLLLCVPLFLATIGDIAAETASDIATRNLLDALEERQMPDISLAVLDRIKVDANASPELKKEVPLRRAAALVAVSKTEVDSKKRAGYLDEAQKALDTFIASGNIADRQAIAAYTQKGNLLVERGRAKADQASRPGADAKSLQAEAVKFFDDAIKSLKGTTKPGEEIKVVTNAEDAVLKVLREVTGQLQKLKAPPAPPPPAGGVKDDQDDKGKGKPPKPVRFTPKQQREIDDLAEDQEALQGKLIQTRLTTAAAMYEKARAYPEKSKEWADAITESAKLFKEIADKYPAKGGGLFARYYEGRNYAHLEKWENAVSTLASLVVIEQKIPLAILLRSRALNTTLEGLIAQKKYDMFDDSARKFALEDVAKLPGARLDSDWLGLKYRAAVVLNARAEGLDPKDPKNKREFNLLQSDAKKLATEVAKSNLDFAAEARELAGKLGNIVEEGERTYQAAWDEAQVALATMQQHLAEFKSFTAAKDAEKAAAAQAASVTARDETTAKIEEAMKLAGIAEPRSADASADDSLKDASIDQINQARYLMTFLLYSAERYEESATLARLLVDRYPNAKGSRQAAKIGMSAWQQLAQRAGEGKARDESLGKAAELAGIVMRVWPDEPESADAATIAIAAAVAARNPVAIVAIINQMSPSSPRRGEVLLRGGSALWREVQEARRSEAGPDQTAIEGWKGSARKALDEGLASVATASSIPEGPLGSLAVAGALARVQIAMDDDDTTKALAILEQPVYGPWTLVAAKSPIIQQGSLAEAALTLALRLFIQAEKFEQAQQAMDGLEKVAGTGEEASAKLTAMYFSMGRDLQSQLEQLGAGKANDPQERAKAEKILGGFETFLDRVAARDLKISSQFWVATTFLTLGSGKGTGAVVSKDKADRYLKRSAEVYEKLLQKVEDPEVTRFEPSIRLRMANIYQELRQWDEAQKQLDWILADPRRQNSLDTQIQAAELLQSAADDAAKNGDTEKANTLYWEAAVGRQGKPVVIWGWGNIANKLARQGFTGTPEKARQSRDAFFNARYRVVECQVARALLPGKASEKKSRLEKAETAITMTHRMYPDLGGPDMRAKFDKLVRQIQKELGVSNPAGLAADDTPAGAGGNP